MSRWWPRYRYRYCPHCPLYPSWLRITRAELAAHIHARHEPQRVVARVPMGLVGT